ncbi:MAG TPA: septum formation family protein [Nocardioides sp.]
MDHPPAALGPQAAQSTSLAWIALALTLVWVPPLGLLIGPLDTFLGLACTLAGTTLAVMVLLRSRHGIDHGKVPASIALASAALHLAVTLALGLTLVMTTEAIDVPEVAEEAGWPVPPEESVTGDCLLSIESPTSTPCDEPHRVEVAGTYTLPDKGWFEDAEAEADPLCSNAVAKYLDIPEEEAAWRYGLSISADEPYKVACWAVSEDPVTGTMRATSP